MSARSSTLPPLPFPPTANSYYRHVRGNVLISADGRDYRARVMVMLRDWRMKNKPLSGRLHVTIVAEMPDHRRRDADNLLKGLLDSLTYARVWSDDSQIYDLGIKKVHTAKTGKGKVTVCVSEMIAAVVA